MSIIENAEQIFSKLINYITDIKLDDSALGNELVRIQRDHILKSKDENGKPFLPLKRRKGLPLYDTGKLFKSINYFIKDGVIGVTTNTMYAKYHQFGTSKIPQRKFMGLSAKDKKRLAELQSQKIMKDWAKKKAKPKDPVVVTMDVNGIGVK